MPFCLVSAISHANHIVDWQENLLEADMPPEWMWPLDSELERWFDDVSARRGNARRGDDREEVPMMRNDLAG